MNETELILSNETALDDEGWALIAPFGEHPKTRLVKVNGIATEQKFIQILDNESADKLLSKENSLFGKIKRAVIGIPVYDGHSDLRDHSPESLGNGGAKNQIGVVDKVRKGAGGIEAHFVLSPDGATAVANGSKFPSALWLVLPNGQRGDATLARPFKLLSVGLTAHPNITGVESLANAKGAGDSTQQTETEMNKLIAAWLLAQGITLANDATDQQVLEVLQRHITSKSGEVTALGNEKSTLAGQITTLENERSTLTGKIATLETAASTAATTLANEQTLRKGERTGRATMAVDLAIQKGKLKIADRAAKITALENSSDFDKDAKALLDAANIVRIPGDSQSGKVLSNTGADDVRSEYKTALANVEKENPGIGAVEAHTAVMSKYPNLADKFKARQEAAAG